MGNVLALVSALCFGVTHFVSGLVSRRAAGMTMSLYAQVAGTVVTVPFAAFAGSGAPAAGALGWGALSGVGTGAGVAFLCRAMGKGSMSLVVPAGDVAAVVLPVLFGLVLLGQRLSFAALAGVCCAVPALWLVSRSHGEDSIRTAAGIPDAFIAGIGFAAQHQLLAVATALAALYPAVPVLLALVFLRERLSRAQVAGLLGAGAAIALVSLG